MMMLQERGQALVGGAGHPTLRRYGWAVYLAITGLLSLGYLLFKGTPVNSGPVFNVIGISSVIAIAIAIRLYRVAILPWGLIAAGLTMFVTGDVLAYNYTRFF